MKDISCIGDITFMEYVIKVFERISNENSRILLENNVFVVLLSNVFDFMNSYQKKSIMKKKSITQMSLLKTAHLSY